MPLENHHRSISYRRQHGVALVLVAAAALLLKPYSQGASRGDWPSSHSPSEWKLLKVRIIARGSTATGGMGTMDSYLAVVSRGKNREETTVRLVHYYASYETGILNERILSGHALHLRLSGESYCGMAAKDFVVQQVFDADALARVRDQGDHDQLPCFIVRH
jgi:hypothetical protein